jgi:hypothetical protein
VIPDGCAGMMPGNSELPPRAISGRTAGRICRHGQGWKPGPTGCILAHMADSEKEPVMLPFQDKEGTGWHVVIRYHAGHERRIDGFATEREALDWIIANAKEVDK